MNKKILVLSGVILLLVGLSFLVILFLERDNLMMTNKTTKTIDPYLGKKVLYVNSYHKGFEWGDGEQAGVENTLTAAGVEFKSVYMDTKNNPSPEFGEKSALLVKDEINSYKPDVVIVTDDAAYKYLVAVHYKNSDLPIVFGGINWDLSSYGGQYSNATGILEVTAYKDMVFRLSKYSKGNRVGFLTGDNISEYRNSDFIKNSVDNEAEIVFVKNFTDWKKEFIEIQKNVDILIIGISAGIEGWDNEEAKKFVLENTKIPTGTEQSWMMPFAMLGYTKNPQEQGEVSAKMAIDIINGENPKEIPIVKNKKGDLFLNLKIANKLGALIESELLKNSTIFE